MNTPSRTRNLHPEAFCLMTYATDKGDTEVLWNSRDGVTPFCITSRTGLEMRHKGWDRDLYRPDFVPPVASRIFVDLTMSRAMTIARIRLNVPFAAAATDAVVRDLARALLEEHHGQPDIVSVTKEMHEAFARVREITGSGSVGLV